MIMYQQTVTVKSKQEHITYYQELINRTLRNGYRKQTQYGKNTHRINTMR